MSVLRPSKQINQPTVETNIESFWHHYLIDTLLAVAGTSLVTVLIYAFQLYPRIPNISIIYLLVVLPLASTRGRYAAVMASIIAFLTFDFFLVPPLFVLTIYRTEEWIALVVFLVDALLTGQLAAALRLRVQEARRRERETRILYELVQATNNVENAEQMLATIAQSVVMVFSSWGVRECAILLPDAQGKLTIQANAPHTLDSLALSSDEYALASDVMRRGEIQGIHDTALVPQETWRSAQRVIIHNATTSSHSRLLLLPLSTGHHVLGVMRLRIQGGLHRFPGETRPEEEHVPSTRTAFFWTFIDQATSVIERVRLQRENLRIEILQRTDALRSALLSSVSHDLRTPLSSIKAAASSLQQEDIQWDEETKRSFARTIEREADRLNRLVGNLLDMSRIEEGALKPEKELYPLPDLLDDVLERLHTLLQGRTINKNYAEDLPPVELDYLQMDQVLTNLIENAVRYTPPGSPIDIRAEQVGHEALIQVADRGPGIPPADRERVFDKFFRVTNTRPNIGSRTGSGLGLAVCKGLVEAHGGRIWLEAREGGGTIFFVALPIPVTEQGATQAISRS
ncbi:ATP-binding protein [Tengunoibacter tsumagoiensis]|uniref:histidine kinase n=1 Tax=Tengunoibacter tsumagoiensis TaxID=2014871 RepID=A0A402A3V2_9CHLR|nr:ATP-binding protein [Tengunoibacter tsumagoiensis]GCE13752.1 hypothetical protein KTT_36110 [Tengunoibacter tsumagoiensis]